MAEQSNNRRKVLLAVVLALAASSMICVLGAAAAGYTLSSPLVDSIVSYFAGGDQQAAQPGGANPVAFPPAAPAPGASGEEGGATGSVGAGSGGGTDGSQPAGDQSCLLGLLCVNASTNSNNSAVNVSANTSTPANDTGALNVNADAQAAGDNAQNCFLGIVCLTANADTQPIDVAANADQQDLSVDANGDVNPVSQQLDLNADVNPSGDAQGDTCLLGLVCLNTAATRPLLLDSLYNKGG